MRMAPLRPLGDTNETNAIKAAFGEHAYQLVVNSTKSMTGHLLGGAGGLESVFTVLSIYHQISPPTINLLNQDPECDLDYCANTARDLKITYALKNNFGLVVRTERWCLRKSDNTRVCKACD
jgi:3-oxoacyl-[acyl-carrier-protein] synthase II